MVYLRPVEEWKDGKEGCSAQKMKVPPQTRRRQPQCQTAQGENNEMWKKESKKETVQKGRQRKKACQCRKNKDSAHRKHKTNTDRSKVNTDVCNQAEQFKNPDLQHLQSNLQQSHKSTLSKHRNNCMPDLSREMRKTSWQQRQKIFNSQNKPNYIRKNSI